MTPYTALLPPCPACCNINAKQLNTLSFSHMALLYGSGKAATYVQADHPDAPLSRYRCFEQKIQEAVLGYLAHSKTAFIALAESYVGLPL